MKHSPLDWNVGRESYKKQIVDIDCRHKDDDIGHESWTSFIRCYGFKDKKEEGLQKARANANFIVKAANNHYFLVEALASLLKECNNSSCDTVTASEAYQQATELINEMRK